MIIAEAYVYKKLFENDHSKAKIYWDNFINLA